MSHIYVDTSCIILNTKCIFPNYKFKGLQEEDLTFPWRVHQSDNIILSIANI